MQTNLTNRARGDVSLRHNGKDYTLRLDFDALEKLSNALPRSVFEIAVSISAGGKLSPSEVLAIVRAAMLGGGNDITEAECKAIITSIGLLQAFKVAADALLVALAPAKAQEHFTEDASAEVDQKEGAAGKA